MACTIDQLRVDQPITVLRDFTDLAGLTLRTGACGVIRGLGLDTARMEIWIELERDGARDTMRFALAATDGPGNGRMRDYFEVAEPGETPAPAPMAVHSAPDTLHAQTPVGRPSGRHVGLKADPQQRSESDHPYQPNHNTSLAATRVACNCDPAFHRDLFPARSELTVAACLRCGTVTCSRSFGDDGRFTGNAWQEYRSVTLPEPIHRWIAGWPRVKEDHSVHIRWPMSADYVRYPTLFYPADARCDSLGELAHLETRLARDQTGQPPTTCLHATHRVKSPPPADLLADHAHPLRGYVMLWQALQLGPDSDLTELIHHAQPRSPGSALAAELLRRRPDAHDLIVTSLRSSDPTRRGVGFLIARDLPPTAPDLASILIELLNSLSLDPLRDVPDAIADRSKGEMLLLLIAELQLATPEILATLKAWMRKIARHDPFLVDCARIVLRELTRAATTPPATP